MRNRILIIVGLAVAALLGAGVWWCCERSSESDAGEVEVADATIVEEEPEAPSEAEEADAADELEAPDEEEVAAAEESAADEEEEAEVLTPQEQALVNWEKTLDAFVERQEDENWQPTKAEVAKFKSLFDQLDAEQRLEEIPHAQNLLLDSAYGFLKAILLDPTEPQEVLESIYNDLLNRPEELKYPVLREVYRVKQHPLRGEIKELDEMMGNLD